jgi:hypothetical protein
LLACPDDHTNAVRVDLDEGVWANIKTGIVAGASPVLL